MPAKRRIKSSRKCFEAKRVMDLRPRSSPSPPSHASTTFGDSEFPSLRESGSHPVPPVASGAGEEHREYLGGQASRRRPPQPCANSLAHRRSGGIRPNHVGRACLRELSCVVTEGHTTIRHGSNK